jgi:hypothetical protein
MSECCLDEDIFYDGVCDGKVNFTQGTSYSFKISLDPAEYDVRLPTAFGTVDDNYSYASIRAVILKCVIPLIFLAFIIMRVYPLNSHANTTINSSATSVTHTLVCKSSRKNLDGNYLDYCCERVHSPVRTSKRSSC